LTEQALKPAEHIVAWFGRYPGPRKDDERRTDPSKSMLCIGAVLLMLK
jgi:hypothetical protein